VARAVSMRHQALSFQAPRTRRTPPIFAEVDVTSAQRAVHVKDR